MSKKYLYPLLMGTLTAIHAGASSNTHDLIDELTEEIYCFEKSKAQTEPPKTTSLVAHLAETAVWSFGASLRTVGDYLRTPAEGTSPKDLGFYGPVGNSLRAVGAVFVGETPTLTRVICDFWKEKNALERLDLVIPHSVAALYCQGQAIEIIVLKYRDLLDGLSLRGYTNYVDTSGEILNGYFVKGLVAGFGRTPKMWETHGLDDFLGTLSANAIQVKDIIHVCQAETYEAACAKVFEAEKQKVNLEERRASLTRTPAVDIPGRGKGTSPVQSWIAGADPAPPPHLNIIPTGPSSAASTAPLGPVPTIPPGSATPTPPVSTSTPTGTGAAIPAPSGLDQSSPAGCDTSYPGTSQPQTKGESQ